jgi:agmatine deiminase
MNKTVFPAEWYKQSAVQLTWPHDRTDWASMLDEVIPCFVSIAKEILKRQRLIVVCSDKKSVLCKLGGDYPGRLFIYEIVSDDTWARDHAGISVFENRRPLLLDFTFNGWGKKFPAGADNALTKRLYEMGAFSRSVDYRSEQPFVLEGGSIETDGCGTIVTTAQCLLAPHRNQPMDEQAIEDQLKQKLGAQRILWLKNGYLAGDDTDGHIDMLARFCNEQTIAYVQASDPTDEHTPALKAMEKELTYFRTLQGDPYNLIPLPMADPVYHEGERLPASYANFLIINDAVLVPVYGLSTDKQAISQLEAAFPDKEIVPIHCLPLIYQHGSLHCLTMQYPEGFVVQPK